MSRIVTTTSPSEPARSVAVPALDGRLVVGVRAPQALPEARRAQLAAAAGLPRRVVDAVVAQGAPLAVGVPVPEGDAQAAAARLREVLPEAEVLAPRPASALWLLALGAGALALVAVAPFLAFLQGLTAALVVGFAGLLLGGGAAFVLARQLAASDEGLRALRARESAVAALPGSRVAWEAVGGLRRATLDLPDLARTDLDEALQVIEARIAHGDDVQATLAALQGTLDHLRAPALLSQGAPDPERMLRAAAAARAEIEGLGR